MMKKHRPRIRKARPRNNSPQKAIAVAPDNGIEPVYYHGGVGGLPIGGYILPRSQTGARARRREVPEHLMNGWVDAEIYDPGVCYVTTSLDFATYWSTSHFSGVVYIVQPEGEIVPDPDYAHRDDCFMCLRARVTAIAKTDHRLVARLRERRSGARSIDDAARFLMEYDLL